MVARIKENDIFIQYCKVNGTHVVLGYDRVKTYFSLHTLCIAYPKGKRPELPYPQNPSKIESNGLQKSE